MPLPPSPYTRLTRNVAGVATYSSLWLAPDHLLIAASNGFSERYARLQLRNVKALFLTASDRGLWWAVVWGVITGLSAIVIGVRLQSGEMPTFSVAFFVLGATGLTWNYILGPGCRAFVITGVQTAPLPALIRRKKARRVLALLQPLIEAAQADMVETAPVAESTPAPSQPA